MRGGERGTRIRWIWEIIKGYKKKTYSPAASLISIRRDLIATPIGILQDAASGFDTFILCFLRSSGASLEFGNSGPRNRIRLIVRVVVDVKADTLLACLDISWNRYRALGRQVSRRLEEDLGTADVELRVAFDGIMESEKLRTYEVVATLEVGGEDNGHAAVVFDHAVSAPFIISCIIAVVPELEPAIADA